MEFKTLVYSKDSGIATIQVNRPEALNALNEEVLTEMLQALDEVTKDDEVRVLVVTGNDQAFAAGADIKNFVTYNPLQAHQYITLGQTATNKLQALGKPTIASIAGFTFGGGFEMALACDIRIAGDNASFGLPEINLGIVPGGLGTQKITRIVGEGKAKELVFLGDVFNAEQALQLGLVNAVVPLDDLSAQTTKVARKLTRKPPVAISTAKELIHLSYDVDLETSLKMVKEKFSFLFATEDQKEGMAAFMESRKATFKGR